MPILFAIVVSAVAIHFMRHDLKNRPFLVAMVMALLGGSIVLQLAGCNRTNVDAANAAAEEFVHQIDGATGFSCAQQDTDGDGYVSCTVFRKGADPLLIECGSERFCVNCARGCKYTQLKAPRR